MAACLFRAIGKSGCRTRRSVYLEVGVLGRSADEALAFQLSFLEGCLCRGLAFNSHGVLLLLLGGSQRLCYQDC